MSARANASTPAATPERREELLPVLVIDGDEVRYPAFELKHIDLAFDVQSLDAVDGSLSDVDEPMAAQPSPGHEPDRDADTAGQSEGKHGDDGDSEKADNTDNKCDGEKKISGH